MSLENKSCAVMRNGQTNRNDWAAAVASGLVKPMTAHRALQC